MTIIIEVRNGSVQRVQVVHPYSFFKSKIKIIDHDFEDFNCGPDYEDDTSYLEMLY